MQITHGDDIDVRLLVRWLGPEGARAGLEKSKTCTVEVLRRLAEALGVPTPGKSMNRQQLIDDIVRIANRRIDKPLADLVRLQEDELVDYFERVDPDREELLELLKGIDAAPGKESRKGLIRFAARELSETGRYIRIATAGTEIQKNADREIDKDPDREKKK